MRRDRIREAIIAAGFGPLCETPPPEGGLPTGDPAPAGTTTPPTQGGGAAPEDRSGFIPRQRFDEVNEQLRAFREAEEKRTREDAERKGEFEKLAATERQKREDAERRAISIARRASFIGAAAGKVTDAEAAYKLASADGMLSDLAVDDEGNAKDPNAPGKIVEELVKRYAFLKSDNKSRSFGDDRSGAGGAPSFDPSKADAKTLLRAGFDAIGTPGARR